MLTFEEFISEMYKENVKSIVHYSHKDDNGNVTDKIHYSPCNSQGAESEAKSKFGHLREFRIRKTVSK